MKPGSARPGVGGEHDGALIVRVSARAVDGRATEAALAAVAESFGIRRSTVRLVSGASSRTKVIDVDAVDPLVLAALLATPGRLPERPVSGVPPYRGNENKSLPAPPAGRPCCEPFTDLGDCFPGTILVWRPLTRTSAGIARSISLGLATLCFARPGHPAAAVTF